MTQDALPLFNGHQPSEQLYQTCMAFDSGILTQLAYTNMFVIYHLKFSSKMPMIARAIDQGLISREHTLLMDKTIQILTDRKEDPVEFDYYLVYLWYVFGDIVLKAEPYLDVELIKSIMGKWGASLLIDFDDEERMNTTRHIMSLVVRKIKADFGTLPEFEELDARLKGLVG